VAGDYPGMIYLGMIDSGKKDIPLLMFLRRNRPAAEGGLIQQFNAGHAKNGELAPVRQTTAAAFSCCLISKEVHNPFLNAIVLRLHDSFFTLIGKLNRRLSWMAVRMS
jgi:hypothetical protein